MNESEQLEELMSLRRAFHANLSRYSEEGWVLKTLDSSGIDLSKPLARFAPNIASSKTSPDFSALEHPSLAYAAGIIDGEGCITITASGHKPPQRKYYSLSVEVCMTTKAEPVLRFLQATFGGSINPKPTKKANCADCLHWKIYGSEAAQCLRRIVKGLMLKAEQANTALELHTLINQAPRQANGDADWSTIRRKAIKLALKMRRLNARGKPQPVWITDQRMLDGSWEEFSGTWPRSAMIVSGKLFALPSLVPGIYARDCASSVPTPRASANEDQAEQTGFGLNLVKAMLPTPTTRDFKDTPGMALETEDRNRNDQLPRRVFSELLPTPTTAKIGNELGPVRSRTDRNTVNPAPTKLGQAISGGLPTSEAEPTTRSGGMRLTPEFLCWLQGYPPNWLKPLVDASVTASYHKRGSPSPKRSRKG